ncbi:hypothetical protein L7F22_056929 [Adiantum nelumboides]|nr:hypothetical protein [Adiantum nelumboides]
MAVDDVLEEEKKPVKGVKKEAKDPFSTSPRKAPSKPIKLELEAHEARPAPKRWREQLAILNEQRKRIVAPVDTMGCEENGRDDRRGDVQRVQDGVESEEDKRKRERFTILISLMLSSQTKDPVTAEAVRNLQTRLDGGLSLESLLAAPQDLITECIAKVGFWRRKTGYITSAAKILKEDFGGDVPKTIDELCSLPGVGPKMSFLALQSAWGAFSFRFVSWSRGRLYADVDPGLNVGIGVDVHVHRVSNRLNWVKSQDPEGTRLQLQSWLPKELHKTINKTLVGFGQVVCLPVGPRCDLCALGAARMCPSYRKVDPKSVLKRVKVEFLPEGTQHPSDARVKPEVEEAIKVEGPDGAGVLLEDKDAVQAATGIKTEAAVKEESLDW